MKTGMVAAELGIGLVAGLAGTLAMTAAQYVEMKLRGRGPSSSPAEAVEEIFEIAPRNPRAARRLTQYVHFGYGTSLGLIRAGLDAVAGVRGPTASAIHGVAVQGTAMAMLPALGVAPPVRTWGAKAIAIEAVHHAVYATAAGLTYDALRSQIQPAGVPRGGLASMRDGTLQGALIGGLTVWALLALGRQWRVARAQDLAEDITHDGRMPTPREREALAR